MQTVWIRVTVSDDNYCALYQAWRQAQHSLRGENYDFEFSFSGRDHRGSGPTGPRRGEFSIAYNSPVGYRRLFRRRKCLHEPEIHFLRGGETLPPGVSPNTVWEGEPTEEGVRERKCLEGSIRIPTPLISPIGLGCKPNRNAGSLRAYPERKRKAKRPAKEEGRSSKAGK